MKAFIVDSVKHCIYKPFAQLDYAMHYAKHFDDAIIYERDLSVHEAQAWGINAPFNNQGNKPHCFCKDNGVIRSLGGEL